MTRRVVLLVALSILTTLLLGAGEKPSAAPSPFEPFDKEIEKINKDIESTTDSKKLDKLEKQLEKAKDKKDKKLDDLLKPLKKQLEKMNEEMDKLVAKKLPTATMETQVKDIESKIDEIQRLYDGAGSKGQGDDANKAPAANEEKGDPKDTLKKVL